MKGSADLARPQGWAALDSALERRRALLWGAALGLIGLGAWLRFHGLDAQSLWFDEILQARITRKPLAWILGHMPSDKPPLDYWLQHFAIRWGGETEWWIRFPAAVWATLTLPVMFLWARSMLGASVGLGALALLAVSPVHIHYAQEGRPYALFILASSVAAWALWELTHRAARLRWWITFGASLLVSLWTLHLTLVSLPLLLIWLGGWWLWAEARHRPERARLRRVVLACLAVSAVCVVTLTPLSRRMQGELSLTAFRPFNVHSPADLDRFLGPLVFGASENQRVPGAALVGLPLLAMGALGALRRRTAAAALALALVAGTAGGMLVFYWHIDHWLEVRYLLGALLPWLMLTAAGGMAVLGLCARVAVSARLRTALAGALLACAVLVGGSLAVAHLLRHPHRKMDWRGVVTWLGANADVGQRVLLMNPWHQIRLDYYLEHLGIPLATEVHPDASHFRARAENLGDCWVLMTLDSDASEHLGWLLGHPAPFTGAEGIRLWRVHDPAAWQSSHPELIDRSARVFADDGLRLDVGEEAFDALGLGWGEAERFEGLHPFRWAVAERFSLFLPLRDALGESALLVRAMAYDYPGAPPQVTSVRISGTEVGWGVIIPGWQIYAMEIPEGTLRAGLNRVDFVIDHAVSPQAVFGVPDPRPLGIGVDWVRLGGPELTGEAEHVWPRSPPEGWTQP